MSGPRVRFAPSPSGQLHVGNARTALFNWLLARRLDGTFILRIEDTDTERSTRASEVAIIEDLRWLGLGWDEGPDRGGPHAPYRQSERADRYAQVAADLRHRGIAYDCFCTPDELEAERQASMAAGQPPKYSGKCRSLTPDVAAERIAAGERAALRFAVPENRDVTFVDIVRGPVTFNTSVIGDPVIVRSDGRPAFNFAVVVDDVAMRMTHVIRGEDHISNTPRQVLIYEAIGATPPQFAHLSLVLGPDHAPLSKRHGATSVAQFREHGYLPEALVNYLALLGWSPGDDQELLSREELIRRFDLDRITHSAAVFDMAKLAWINRHYMKEADPDRIVTESVRYFEDARIVASTLTDEGRAYLRSLLPMAIGSVDRLEEIPSRLLFLFRWEAESTAALVRAEPGGEAVASAVAAEIGDEPLTDRERFRALASRVRDVTGLKGRALFHPMRVILTGADSGPELDLAVPAIEHGARLSPAAGIAAVPSCATRARAVHARLADR